MAGNQRTLSCLCSTYMKLSRNVHSRRTFHTTKIALSNGSSSQIIPNVENDQVEINLQKVGVIFDIDGVLVRGRKVIKSAEEAIHKLRERNIPTLFLTNGGCETEEHKAESLQQHLGVEIDPDQVVLSHSPLRILNILHDKHVVVSGQGPVSEIAQMCGFSKVSHIDDIDQHFPDLDVNDREKRNRMPCPPRKPFFPVEAILLMGEPVNWEKSFQIIIDILLTNGHPYEPHVYRKTHLPVVAVNTDYLWMSEAVNPRFGHGGFLLGLECLYQKLTNQTLDYTAILGKPNLFTYRYTEGVMHNLAEKMFGRETKIQTIYAVGDNVDTDVYGANHYNNYIKAVQHSDIATDALHPKSTISPDRMKTILVRTGVFGGDDDIFEKKANHLHRDTIDRPELCVPTHICDDVLHAVNKILKEENLT